MSDFFNRDTIKLYIWKKISSITTNAIRFFHDWKELACIEKMQQSRYTGHDSILNNSSTGYKDAEINFDIDTDICLQQYSSLPKNCRAVTVTH